MVEQRLWTEEEKNSFLDKVGEYLLKEDWDKANELIQNSSYPVDPVVFKNFVSVFGEDFIQEIRDDFNLAEYDALMNK